MAHSRSSKAITAGSPGQSRAEVNPALPVQPPPRMLLLARIETEPGDLTLSGSTLRRCRGKLITAPDEVGRSAPRSRAEDAGQWHHPAGGLAAPRKMRRADDDRTLEGCFIGQTRPAF